MEKILLTGGAGFIGSHLAERLLSLGCPLILVDDLNDFYPERAKRRNLNEVRSRGEFTFVHSDICDQIRLKQTFEQHRPEVIIHLAARAGVRPSLDQPLLYEKTNVQGTLVLLELARTAGVRKFIFASSSSIYGITSATPFSEDESNPNPISPYGVTKLAGEKLCYCYTHLYRLPAICLRFFTVYGPRQRPDLAIHKFAKLIEDGKAIPVFGDGTSSRDYTYVDDIVDGILAALELETDFEIFNLGSSSPVPLELMIGLLEKQLGKKARLEFREPQTGDMPFTYANLTKAKRLLNYEPRVPFETGLSHFVEWFHGSQ